MFFFVLVLVLIIIIIITPLRIRIYLDPCTIHNIKQIDQISIMPVQKVKGGLKSPQGWGEMKVEERGGDWWDERIIQRVYAGGWKRKQKTEQMNTVMDQTSKKAENSTWRNLSRDPNEREDDENLLTGDPG